MTAASSFSNAIDGSPLAQGRKDWPERYILVTFGLEHQLLHPRIAEAAEPYPNRWTHHVLVQELSDIDGELLGWIDESYRFSLSRRKRRPAS